jgi:type IV pilus assembly protein PilV
MKSCLHTPPASRSPAPGKSARNAGFSLIEVLISIIILSFGLLGMVGLQAAALQANRDARLQSVATTLGRELAEMMRGNKAVAILPANPYLGAYSNPAGTTPMTHPSPSYCLNADAAVAAPATSACIDTAEIARAEMTGWLAKVDNALPGARVEVCVDPSPYDTTTGLPQWSSCSSAGGGAVVIKIGWTRSTTNRDNTGDQAFSRAVRPSVLYSVTAGSA